MCSHGGHRSSEMVDQEDSSLRLSHECWDSTPKTPTRYFTSFAAPYRAHLSVLEQCVGSSPRYVSKTDL